MRIGVRGHDVKADSFQHLVEEINRQGFLCSQLALKKAIKEFPTHKEAMTPGLACYIKEVFANNHVDIAVLGCYLNLANPDKQQLEDIIDTYKRHIQFASILGCGLVGTETGACNVEYKYEPANHSEEVLDIFIKNLSTVVEYAEKLGVIIGIEPVYKHIMNDAKRTRKVLDAIGSPNLQVIFDPVNLLYEGNYHNHKEIVEEFLQLNGKDIAVIHAKDFVIENDKLKPVACGMGLFEYDSLLSYIKKNKPYIHVLLENTTPENAETAREFMEQKYSSL